MEFLYCFLVFLRNICKLNFIVLQEDQDGNKKKKRNKALKYAAGAAAGAAGIGLGAYAISRAFNNSDDSSDNDD